MPLHAGRKASPCRPLTGVRVPLRCWGEIPPRRHRAAPTGRMVGFTLVELMIVMTVLLLAFLGLSQSLVASMHLTRVNKESALASDGIREMVEVLSGVEDFATVFKLYNSNPGDDPGPGPAPGSGFAVRGLEALENDPDGLVGEIVFPTLNVGGNLELREDIVDPDLGMPRDLDGKNGVDAFDHSGDYRLLPVVVRLRWEGFSGERVMEVRTLIADR